MEYKKISNISTAQRNLRIAFRRIIKGKFYSVVNMIGLSIGLACSFLIMLYVLSETGFDKYHKNRNSIFRFTYHFAEEGETILQPFIPSEEIKNVVPGILHSSLIGSIKTSAFLGDKQIEVTGKGVEMDIFEIFTIPFISGNPYNFNVNPNTIIISRELKTKLFAQQPAEGKNVLLEIEDNLIPFVIGTIEDFPVK